MKTHQEKICSLSQAAIHSSLVFAGENPTSTPGLERSEESNCK